MVEIRLRRADLELESSDSQHIWQWRNDATTREMSIISEPISWADHKVWYGRSIENPRRYLWIIEALNSQGLWQSSGVIRLDVESEMMAYIGLNIDPQQRSKGLGRAALRELIALAFEQMGLDCLQALIKGVNQPSIALFTSLGFVKMQQVPHQEGLDLYTLGRSHALSLKNRP